MDDFIIDLYSLAEPCQHRQLHDEMVRDRIVVGIKDSKVPEKHQMDKEFTSEKVKLLARNSERIKQQQAIVRSNLLTEPHIKMIKSSSHKTTTNKF